MNFFVFTYVLEGQVDFEAFSKEEIKKMIKEEIETGRLYHDTTKPREPAKIDETENEEKKKKIPRKDFGDYKVYILNNGLMGVHEIDEENPRVTILSKPPIVHALEGRIGSISKSDFEKLESRIKEMYGEGGSFPNGYFGRYFFWGDLTDAERCIIEHDRVKRITFYARDKDNFKSLVRRLGIN